MGKRELPQQTPEVRTEEYTPRRMVTLPAGEKIERVPELETNYTPIDIPLGANEGPDIRNLHIRLTATQAIAYRRLRAGLVSLAERLDDGRLVDDTIRGQPLQWLLERIAEAK